MPKGGHSRGGGAQKTAAQRALDGSETRAHHRAKGDAGTPAPTTQPPPGMSRAERPFWNYYAPILAAERRLTLKARDTLAGYCSLLAVVAYLRRQLASRKKSAVANRPKLWREMRQQLLAKRLYENDLLLNPASAIRAPKAPHAGEGPEVPTTPDDPFNEFDAPPMAPEPDREM